jgi:hypothetical protein
VPRKIAKDDMPRRGRGARVVAIEADAERGLVMRILLQSPKDMVAGVLAFAAVSAIVANALFLQSGHHPAPMFGSVVTLPATDLPAASPLPRPRPAVADACVSEPKAVVEPKPALEPRPVLEKPAEPRAVDPLTNLVKATSAAPVATSNTLRPPASIPLAPRAETPAGLAVRRTANVQRALTEYGYGQLKPSGTIGPDTQAAIAKFEREHRMPVTGQMSDRLVRELGAMTGHPID